MKKILLLFSTLIIILSLCSCSSPPEDIPEGAINIYINSLKEYDTKTMSEYTVNTNLMEFLNAFNGKFPKDENATDSEGFVDFKKSIFKNVDCQIENTTVNDDTAEVNIKISNADASVPFKRWIDEFKKIDNPDNKNNSQKGSDLLYEIFNEDMKNPEKMISEEITVKLKKIDGKWDICEDNEDFIHVITGGMSDEFN